MSSGFSLERNILEDVLSSSVDFYDTETPVGQFAEKLYLKGYIAGKLSAQKAVMVQGLTELGRARLAQLKQA